MCFMVLAGVRGLTQEFSLDLNPQQEKTILNRLNDICGDSWCEGEYNLVFQSVLYVEEIKSHYVITFSAQDSYTAEAPLMMFSCDIENTYMVQAVLFNALNLRTNESENELYNVVNTCIYEKLSAK